MTERSLVFCTAPAGVVKIAVAATLRGTPREEVYYVGSSVSPFRETAGATFIAWGEGIFTWSRAMALWGRLRRIGASRAVLPLNNPEGTGYGALRLFARMVTRGEVLECLPDGGVRTIDEGLLRMLLRPEERWHAAVIGVLDIFRPLLGYSGQSVPRPSRPEPCIPSTVRELSAPEQPAVSVVIRTYNEAALVETTLAAVFGQKGVSGGFEVVVIDSSSSDNTLDLCKKFPVRLFSIPRESFSYGFALNLGARLARGKVVANLSAHAVPADSGWLAELVAPLADPAVAGVYGRELPMDGNCGHFEAKLLEDSFGPAPRRSTENPFFSNANSAVPAALLREFPFDEGAGWGEDNAWAHTMQSRGRAIEYRPRAAVHHSHNTSARDNFVRCLKHHRTLFGGYLKGREEEVRSGFRRRLAGRAVSFRKFLGGRGGMPLAAALFYAPWCEYVNYLGCREAAEESAKRCAE